MKTRKKGNQLNVHLSDEVRTALNEVEEATGSNAQIVAKALFQAFAKYWNTHKKITLPFEIVTDSYDFKATGTIETKRKK